MAKDKKNENATSVSRAPAKKKAPRAVTWETTFWSATIDRRGGNLGNGARRIMPSRT